MNLLEKINFEGELLKIKRESSDIPGVSEIVEGYLSSYMDHNPVTVAKSFMESTKNVAYDPNIKEIRESIVNTYQENTFIYELKSVKYDIESMRSPFYKSIITQIDKILENENNDEVKTAIKQDLAIHSYIPQIRGLVEYANKYDKELNSTADHYAKTVYSPVHETAKGNTIFNSLGVNFSISEGNQLVEAPIVQDKLYNDLVEAVNTFEFFDTKIQYYTKDKKVLLSENEEGTLKLEVDGNEVAIDENLRRNLLTSRVFDANSLRQLDLLQRVIENYSNIVRLDNVKQLHMRNFQNKKLNVLTLENSFAIHKMDTETRTNQIDVFETANEAISDVKAFIGYDLSESLRDHLKVEQSQLESLKEKRSNIIEKIEFLKEEKSKLTSDETIAESEAIKKANELIEGELTAHTNELEKITSKISKISEKKTDFTDQGFVEGIIKKDPPSSLKDISKGDDIWIFAEDYTTSGAKDDIIIKLNNGKELRVKKELVAPTS